MHVALYSAVPRNILEPFAVVAGADHRQFDFRPAKQQARQRLDQRVHALISFVGKPPADGEDDRPRGNSAGALPGASPGILVSKSGSSPQGSTRTRSRGTPCAETRYSAVEWLGASTTVARCKACRLNRGSGSHTSIPCVQTMLFIRAPPRSLRGRQEQDWDVPLAPACGASCRFDRRRREMCLAPRRTGENISRTAQRACDGVPACRLDSAGGYSIPCEAELAQHQRRRLPARWIPPGAFGSRETIQ